MFKKIIYIVFFTLLFNPLTFSFTKTKIVYEKANNLANTFRSIYNPYYSWEDAHSLVAFWYKSTWISKIVRINLWYWWTKKYWSYYVSNIDQNLDSVYYNWSGSKSAKEIVEINISN